MVEVDDEDLAVADLSGFCRSGNGFDGLLDLVGIDGDLDLDLGQEADRVFGAAIDFRMALLPAISLHFRHRETMNANGGQGVTDFFELEWLDDRHNNFHGSYPRLARPGHARAISTEVHHAEKFHYAGTADLIESNAVPDRRYSLTVYESAPFRGSAGSGSPALFGRAQNLISA